jgi:hypothetical protein
MQVVAPELLHSSIVPTVRRKAANFVQKTKLLGAHHAGRSPYRQDPLAAIQFTASGRRPQVNRRTSQTKPDPPIKLHGAQMAQCVPVSEQILSKSHAAQIGISIQAFIYVFARFLILFGV